MNDATNDERLVEQRKSTFAMMGLPTAFASFLLTFAFIILISPYFDGMDFGIIKVPSFQPSTKNSLRIFAPVGFIVLLFLFLPVWRIRANVTKRQLETLMKRLKHRKAHRRREAALALGKLGPAAHAALPELIEALDDPDRFVRENAAKALESVGAAAVRPLIVAMRHQKGLAIAGETPMVSRPVPRLLEVIGEDDVRSALVEIGRAAVPALTHAFRNSGPASKAPIAAALRKIESAELDDAITRALSDADNEIRLGGAVALAESASPAAVPALTALLQDSYPKIRAVAVAGLGKSRSADAIASLVQVLNVEKESAVRYEAVRALRQLADHIREAIPALVSALKDPTLLVQLAAAMALGEIGPPAKTGIPPLTEALSHQDEQMRKAVANALERIRRNS